MLRQKLLQCGASMRQICGVETPEEFGDYQKELSFIRNSVALADFSFMRKLSFPEVEGADFLDTILPANILKLRYGKIADTFLADENGEVVSEVLAANIDDRIFLFLETDCADCLSAFENENVAFENISGSHSVLSIDGPLSWKLASEIFGSDILNLSYMSVEKYDFSGGAAYVCRSGKTGEFGYQIMVENKLSEELFERLKTGAEKLGGGLAGWRAHAIARLQGNFFNIFGEGVLVKNPLESGLQWMIDISKDSFVGSRGIFENRKTGVGRRLAAVKSECELRAGAKIFNASDIVGEVVSGYKVGNEFVGLALFEGDFGSSGFDYCLAPNGIENVSTISRPTIMAQSLLRGIEDD